MVRTTAKAHKFSPVLISVCNVRAITASVDTTTDFRNAASLFRDYEQCVCKFADAVGTVLKMYVSCY